MLDTLIQEANMRAMEYAHGGHTIASDLVSRLSLALTAAQAEAETLRAQLARNAQEEESGDLPVSAYLEDFLNPPVGYLELARRQCGPNADPTVVNAQARGMVARAFEAAIRCQLDRVVESWESAVTAARAEGVAEGIAMACEITETREAFEMMEYVPAASRRIAARVVRGMEDVAAESLYHSDVYPLPTPGFRKAVPWSACPASSQEEYRYMASELIAALARAVEGET